MGPARKGQPIRQVITARAWNDLNKKTKSSDVLGTDKSRFPNIIVTGYDPDSPTLGRFRTVALLEPLFIPSLADDVDPAYDSLEFRITRSLSSSSSLGITQGPSGQGLGTKVVIHGITWAVINVTDTASIWADIDSNNRLRTVSTGTIRILWKPAGLGIKQCLVVLGVASKASTGSGGICYLRTNLTERSTSPARLGSATASKVQVDANGNILGYETPIFTVWNTTRVTQAAGTLSQYKEISPGFYLIDVGDCSPISSGLNPVNPVNEASSAFNNTMQINLSNGINI